MTPISTRSRQERSLTELYEDHEHLADPAITDRAWAQATREVRSGGRVWRGPSRWLAAAAVVGALGLGAGIVALNLADRGSPADPATAVADDVQSARDVLESLAQFPGGPPLVILTNDSLNNAGADLSHDTVPFLDAATNPLVTTLSLTAEPTTGEVSWPDGRREPAPLISQQAAFDAFAGMREPCPSCTPVTLSGLNLVSREIITATGAVTMPVWEGRVAGSSYPLRWLAVAPDQIVGAPDGPGLGGDETLTPVDSWSPTAGSSVIRISFHGSPDVGPCATTYVPAVVESTDGVAIALRGVPGPTYASSHMTCSMNATSMTMDVPVPSPIGSRPLLDASWGGGVTPTG